MWRHIDVQADWRSWTYGRAPNANARPNTDTEPPFLYVDSETPPHLVAFYDALGHGGNILDLTPGPSRGTMNSTLNHRKSIQTKSLLLQARIQEFSSGGVQPSEKKFWKAKKKQYQKKKKQQKEREREGGGGRVRIHSALVWSKYNLAIETACKTIICHKYTPVFSPHKNTFVMMDLAL